MIENIYQLFLSTKLSDDEKNSLLSTLHDSLHDNPLYQSAYYSNKTVITQDDVNQLLYLLQRDTYSFDKKIIAARYFITQGNNTKAKALLAEIPKSKCEQACLIEKEKISKGYSLYRVISNYSKFESEEAINYQIDLFEKIAFLIVTLFIGATLFRYMRKI